ncbi:MAG: cytochrome c oxidase subunit II [Limisphaerales bacterium]
MEKLLGLPVLASEHGKDVDKLLIYVHWLMIALFVFWMGYFVYALFRFHKSRHPKADYVGIKSHFSNYLELGVAAVEAVLLIGFAVPLWAKVVDKFPEESKATVIKIVAQQFAWNVHYAGPDGVFGKQDISLANSDNPLGMDAKDPKGKDDVLTLNEVHVPVNKPVIIYLTSKDVIHSFKIIAMRVTQDAIPGMMIPVWFTPTMEGKYQINCAQLCGNGHYGMAMGALIVESEADYTKWLTAKAKAGSKSEGYE